MSGCVCVVDVEAGRKVEDKDEEEEEDNEEKGGGENNEPISFLIVDDSEMARKMIVRIVRNAFPHATIKDDRS